MQVDNSSVFAAAISQNYRVRFVEPFATFPPTKSKLLYPGVEGGGGGGRGTGTAIYGLYRYVPL